MTLTFTEKEFQDASLAWGCNCGPSALAFALQVTLNAVRPAIPQFFEKRYTSPSMMQSALAYFEQPYRVIRLITTSSPRDADPMFDIQPALVRIQWTGPWTAPGANPRWAYRQTHWIATWLRNSEQMVFDCNGGPNAFAKWKAEIVPFITAHVPRADGGWFPTNIWRLLPKPSTGGAA